MIVALVASLALLLFVSANLFSTFFNSGDNRVTTIDTDSSSTGNFSGMGHMMGGEQSVVLDESGQPMTALQLPELLEPDSESASEITYTVTAQAGKLPSWKGKRRRRSVIMVLILDRFWSCVKAKRCISRPRTS